MAGYPDFLPRRVPEDALDEFIAIYRRQFKEDIMREEARIMAFDLLCLYRLLSRPLPGEQGSATRRDADDEGVSSRFRA